MKRVADHIHGYTYGEAGVPPSGISAPEFENLKTSVGFTPETERYLKLAGAVLADHVKEIVDLWRSQIIAGIPHLARHTRSPEGQPLPDYLGKSNLRFQQWILDTCFRLYDQDWVDYQIEIALRHTTQKKNQTDNVSSTPYVPFRDIIAFTSVMNETIKPYLSKQGHSAQEIDNMHQAWCKSIQLQLALWAKLFTTPNQSTTQW